MKIILTILKRFIIGLIRNRANLGFMVVLPIVFTLVFGVVPNLSHSGALVDVVDHDNTVVSQAIIHQINTTSGYTARVTSAAKATSDLRNLNASVVITLPKGLQQEAVTGKNLKIDWQASPNAGNSSIISELMNLQGRLKEWVMTGSMAVQQLHQSGVSNTASAASAFVDGMQKASTIHNLVTTKGVLLSHGQVQRHSLSGGQQVIMGFATMFIIFTVFGSTGSIYQEKKNGTWSRFKASPVSRSQILAGFGIGFFVVGWVQFLIMDLTGLLFFGHTLPLTGWTVLIVSLYVLAIVGIALTIATVVNSYEQHMIIGSFIGVATSMLGGAYWPIDLEPTWMQKVAWFVPQSWAIDAFKASAIGVISAGSLVLPLAVLAAFALVFFSAGILQLRYS